MEKDNIHIEFGKRLAGLRAERGISQAEAARMMNIAQSTYAGYESAVRKVRLDTIQDLARFYGVTASFLTENLGENEREFGDGMKFRLTLLREKEGLSQKELAEKLGVATSTVEELEQGKRADMELLSKLAILYGVTYDYLIEFSVHPERTYEEDAKIRDLAIMSLNRSERNLIENLRKLNPEGEEYICRQMDFALSQPEYKKGTADAKKEVG